MHIFDTLEIGLDVQYSLHEAHTRISYVFIRLTQEVLQKSKSKIIKLKLKLGACVLWNTNLSYLLHENASRYGQMTDSSVLLKSSNAC